MQNYFFLVKSKNHSVETEIYIMVLSEIPLYRESLKGYLSLVVFSGADVILEYRQLQIDKSLSFKKNQVIKD